MPVQKASTEYGIPSGTLYGRCKKVGIGLSKTAAVHWTEGDMKTALENVRTGGLSINQASLQYNLPYSSLYGRINRLKRDNPQEWAGFHLEPEGVIQPGATEQEIAAAAAAAAVNSGVSMQDLLAFQGLLDNERTGNLSVYPSVGAAAAAAAAAAAVVGASPSMVSSHRLLDAPLPSTMVSSAAAMLSIPKPLKSGK